MASLPNYVHIQLDGLVYRQQSALLRTEMESGPPKQAKFKSRVMVEQDMTLFIQSKANYTSFMTWFNTDISYGADWFTYTSPLTGNTISARIKGGTINSATPLDPNLEFWKIQVTLEQWSDTA